MVFAAATRAAMVPSLACPMPLNELKTSSWAFKTKAAALQQQQVRQNQYLSHLSSENCEIKLLNLIAR
jgi:hypothetical protein